MNVTFDMIYGLGCGMEYVPASYEADIPHPCVIIDFACFRWIIELTGDGQN